MVPTDRKCEMYENMRKRIMRMMGQKKLKKRKIQEIRQEINKELMKKLKRRRREKKRMRTLTEMFLLVQPNQRTRLRIFSPRRIGNHLHRREWTTDSQVSSMTV